MYMLPYPAGKVLVFLPTVYVLYQKNRKYVVTPVFILDVNPYTTLLKLLTTTRAQLCMLNNKYTRICEIELYSM